MYAPKIINLKMIGRIFNQLQDVIEYVPPHFNARIGKEVISGIKQRQKSQTATTDYVITNICIHPKQILDIRTLNSANARNDHSLLLGKMKLTLMPKRDKNTTTKVVKINIESLWDPATKDLYQKRLKGKINTNPILECKC